LLTLELLHLRVQILQLLLEARLPLERLAGEILPAGGKRLASLGVELDNVLFFAVTTSATPRLTFCRDWSCFS
jgi:hypothetical protein